MRTFRSPLPREPYVNLRKAVERGSGKLNCFRAAGLMTCPNVV